MVRYLYVDLLRSSNFTQSSAIHVASATPTLSITVPLRRVFTLYLTTIDNNALFNTPSLHSREAKRFKIITHGAPRYLTTC